MLCSRMFFGDPPLSRLPLTLSPNSSRVASACVGVEAPDRGDTRSGTAWRRELFARHEVQWPWGATAANVVFAANVYPQDELRGVKRSHQELRGITKSGGGQGLGVAD